MNRYRIELSCTAPEWWRYNIEMTAAGYDDTGAECGYYSVEDRIAEPGSAPAAAPEGYPADRCTALECGPCARVLLYLYVVPHTLPETDDIEQTPPLPGRLTIWRDGRKLRTEQLAINPWGGMSRCLTIGEEKPQGI